MYFGSRYTSLAFLSVTNSARSQMAEGLARTMFGSQMRVQSAGSQPGTVHPQAIAAMREAGIDITGQHSKSVDSVDPESLQVVITLCAEPLSGPGWSRSLHYLDWPLPDPASAADDAPVETVAAQFRAVRDELRPRLWALARGNPPDGLMVGPRAEGRFAAIEALIRSTGLPTEGTRDQFPDAYVVARRADELVGVAALEVHGRVGLLRSVAVAPGERGRGIGLMLIAERLVAASLARLTSVYLLTTAAAPLYRRFGFADADRASAPTDLAASPEFAALRPSIATCLRLDLPANAAEAVRA